MLAKWPILLDLGPTDIHVELEQHQDRNVELLALMNSGGYQHNIYLTPWEDDTSGKQAARGSFSMVT